MQHRQLVPVFRRFRSEAKLVFSAVRLIRLEEAAMGDYLVEEEHSVLVSIALPHHAGVDLAKQL